MSLKRAPSPSVSPPPSPKRGASSSAVAGPSHPAPEPPSVVESTYYYILCQIPHGQHASPHTNISRCYTTAAEALGFVRNLVHGWEPHIDRTWEEPEDDDDGEDDQVLLRVTTPYDDDGAHLRLLCSERVGGGGGGGGGGEVTISVQRVKVPVAPPLPPPPVAMERVFVVVQRDVDARAGTEGVAVSRLHGAYAARKEANKAARRVLRLVGGGLDAVGRISCRHEESMDEEGLYEGTAYVEEEERSRVEVVVERLDIK